MRTDHEIGPKRRFPYILRRWKSVSFPNPRRPGIGLRPRSESQRPLLPQHVRNCPVLEAGSGLGVLDYPPLAEHELFQVGYEGEGKYQLQYSVNATGHKWEPLFTVTYQLPVGGIGATKEEVKLVSPSTPESTQTASMMARMFHRSGRSWHTGRGGPVARRV